MEVFLTSMAASTPLAASSTAAVGTASKTCASSPRPSRRPPSTTAKSSFKGFPWVSVSFSFT